MCRDTGADQTITPSEDALELVGEALRYAYLVEFRSFAVELIAETGWMDEDVSYCGAVQMSMDGYRKRLIYVVTSKRRILKYYLVMIW